MKHSILSLSFILPSVVAFTAVQQQNAVRLTTSSSLNSQSNPNQDLQPEISRRGLFEKSTASAVALSTMLGTMVSSPLPSNARLDPVDNPSLLPSTADEVVIQTEKFLTSGQVKRMSDLIKSLERDTGFRLRVLCQSYPNTVSLWFSLVSFYEITFRTKYS